MKRKEIRATFKSHLTRSHLDATLAHSVTPFVAVNLCTITAGSTEFIGIRMTHFISRAIRARIHSFFFFLIYQFVVIKAHEK